ncbi:MAG: hypothetical protein ABIG68_10520, partial [Acidobacteriota bacterium]
MEPILRDLRFGWRMLNRGRGVTLVAVLTLALCIGANTSIFTIVNAVLLRPLPYAEPERLVQLNEAFPKVVPYSVPFSAPDVVEFKGRNRVFDSLAAYESISFDISGVERPERLDAARVSA